MKLLKNGWNNSVLGRSTKLCPSQSCMEIYSFEPLAEPVLSCNNSKEYTSKHDCDGHISVDLPSTELLNKVESYLMFQGQLTEQEIIFLKGVRRTFKDFEKEFCTRHVKWAMPITIVHEDILFWTAAWTGFELQRSKRVYLHARLWWA